MEPYESDAALEALILQATKVEFASRAGLDAYRAVSECLAKEHYFRPARYVRGGRGSHSFHSDLVAPKMVRIARKTGDPAKAIAWLKKVSSATSGVGGAVKALYGVNCQSRVALSTHVELVPILELPDSEMREWVLDQHNQAFERGGLFGFPERPTAALVRRGKVDPLFFSDESQLSASVPPITWFEELDDASLLLALVPGTIPREVVHWMHYDDPDIALLTQMGISRSSFDTSTPMGYAAMPIDSENMRGILPAYDRLKAETRVRLQLALRRLIRSRSHSQIGDKAIDLAIALEVLFMNKETDEISHKISSRAARLLYAARGAQLPLFRQFKALYDIRSRTVHGGHPKSEYDICGVKRPAFEIVRDVDKACTNSIRKFLEMGNIPSGTEWLYIEF